MCYPSPSSCSLAAFVARLVVYINILFPFFRSFCQLIILLPLVWFGNLSCLDSVFDLTCDLGLRMDAHLFFEIFSSLRYLDFQRYKRQMIIYIVLSSINLKLCNPHFVMAR